MQEVGRAAGVGGLAGAMPEIRSRQELVSRARPQGLSQRPLSTHNIGQQGSLAQPAFISSLWGGVRAYDEHREPGGVSRQGAKGPAPGAVPWPPLPASALLCFPSPFSRHVYVLSRVLSLCTISQGSTEGFVFKGAHGVGLLQH